MRLDDDEKEDVGYLSLIKISLDNANYLRKLKKKDIKRTNLYVANSVTAQARKRKRLGGSRRNQTRSFGCGLC